MTTREMLNEHLKGKTYCEIAEMCGMSKQNVHNRIKRLISGRFNRIVYKGIYDYFLENENETFGSFTEKINQNETIMYHKDLIDFICGRRKKVTMNVINKICEVIGKPFEETFKERGNNDR